MRGFTFRENLTLGKEYLLHYRDICKFPFKSADEISAFQLSKVKEIITLAFNKTTFYKELYSQHGLHPEDIKSWDDFRKIPTIAKLDIIQNHSKLIVESKRHDKSIFISRSSGSSGQIVDILYDGSDRISLLLIYLRMLQQSAPYKPFDTLAYISTSKYPYRSLVGMYKRTYLYTLTPHAQLMRQLEQLCPIILCSYPSILLELIAKHKSRCKQLKPRAIFTNSEHSTQDQRNFIGSIFNCPVYDEYSSEELVDIGHQCKYLNYHLQEDCSYIEVLNPNADIVLPEGQIGEIVGTCLLNRTMPIIRYRQGDLGSLKQFGCSCHNSGRLLSDIAGRKNASFILADGSIIPSGKILDWTYKLLLDYKLPIEQFQVIQKTIDEVEVMIVPLHSYNESDHDKIIIESFAELFNTVSVTSIKKVQEIPKTPAGKHIPILSLVQK